MGTTKTMKIFSWKYTAAVVLSTVLAVSGIVYTHNTIRDENDNTRAYASMIPASQTVEHVKDEGYKALTGDEYQAYLKAEEERKAREEAERKAAEEAAAKKAAEEAAAKEAAQKKRTQPTGTAPVAGTPDPGSAKAYAADQVAARGWGTEQYDCLVALWQKESGWNHYAYNASSGATGIPQALPGSKMASAGADWQTNYETQINWGLGYISGRYGNPCGAWSHSQATNWY